jgi:threonine/homoserine/homoserine lactone efflux protein
MGTHESLTTHTAAVDILSSLLHLSAIHILMAMVPGPNTVVVSYAAASISRRAGLQAVLGVVLASLMWVTLSLAGIGILLMQAGALYNGARLAGAAYLIYAGYRMLRAPADRGVTTHPRPRRRRPLVAGLLTTLSNPKSAVFWTSVFALVVPPGVPAWFYAAIIAVVALQSAAWYGLVALVLSTAAARGRYLRLAAWLDRTAGAVMVLLGLRLANDVRVEFSADSL